MTKRRPRRVRSRGRTGWARGVAVAVAALGSPVFHAAAQEKARTPAVVRAEIEARTEDLLAAYRRGDPLGVAAVFADDATISGPNGLRVLGRAAIDSFWSNRSLAPRWTIETFETGGGPDQPWQVARSIRVTTSGARADTTRTDFLLVWKRGADGRLRIHYDIYN